MNYSLNKENSHNLVHEIANIERHFSYSNIDLNLLDLHHDEK